MVLSDHAESLITIMTLQIPGFLKTAEPHKQPSTPPRLPSSNPWGEASRQIAGKTGKPTARLQCRSFPSGVDIIIDGKHTEQITPHTFNELAEGEHEIEMQYVNPGGEIVSKKEYVSLKLGKRVVSKLRFIQPKTLA